MTFTFYDNNGKPIAYTEDNIHIYLFSGKAVAYIDGDSIYNYNGNHLGFFENGWARDHDGACVFFTENASGVGPIKPIKRVKPIKGIKSIKPIKKIKQIRPLKPIKGLVWSQLSGINFFY